MKIPLITGQPLHLWLGVLLLVLISLQILTGRRIIKIPFAWHRRNGYFILLVAIVHALIGLGIQRWGFTY